MARQKAAASTKGPKIRSLGLYTHHIDLSCYICKNRIKEGEEFGFVNDFKACRTCWDTVGEEEDD